MSKSQKISAGLIFAITGVLVVALSIFAAYYLIVSREARAMAPTGEFNGSAPNGDYMNGTYNEGLPNLNILVLGIDNSNLPDIMLYVHFNGERETLDIVSLPRDTNVQLTTEQRAAFTAINRNPPNQFKLNEMFTRAGARGPNGHGLAFLQSHIENILDVEFDYYVLVDLRAFRYIVDALGGIYMDVPQRLFYRGRQLPDGTWDAGEIHIDIQAGWQRLNGSQAEQVVRFRQFPDGDIGRIRMQHLFLQAFMSQVLTMEALMNEPLTLFNSFVNHIDTNIGLASVIRYNNRGILNAIDYEQIGVHTLPGSFITGHSNYFIDEMASLQLIRDIQSGAIRQEIDDD
ncbi:MAG: LCP family protein [Defluviitaleaceae bacterium]|nr:LCP family protein [Defluviitaleaceae bacterium]